MLYNKIHTDKQINVLCGTVEKYRVKNEKCRRYSSPRQPMSCFSEHFEFDVFKILEATKQMSMNKKSGSSKQKQLA